MVTVSQNKLGVAIHLLWNNEALSQGKDVRCSIDLIPTFTIEEESLKIMTKSVNQAMFSWRRPPGWFKTLVDYANRNRKMSEDEGGLTDAVMMKMINYCKEDYTYIRPSWKQGPSQVEMSSVKSSTEIFSP